MGGEFGEGRPISRRGQKREGTTKSRIQARLQKKGGAARKSMGVLRKVMQGEGCGVVEGEA